MSNIFRDTYRRIFNLDAIEQKHEEERLAQREEDVSLSVRVLDGAIKAIEAATKNEWNGTKSPVDLLRDLNNAAGELSGKGYKSINPTRIEKVKTAAVDAMKAAYAKNAAEKIVRDDFADLRQYGPEVSHAWTDNALLAAAHEVLASPEEEWDVVETPGEMLQMMYEVHSEIGFEFEELEELFPQEETATEAEGETVEDTVDETEERKSPYTEEETVVMRAALEKIMTINGRQTEETLALNLDYYAGIAGPSPELIDMWREYTNEFDKSMCNEIALLADLTPEAQSSVGKLSKDKQAYVGKAVGEIKIYPIAESGLEDGALRYYVAAFEGNKEELLQQIDETYPDGAQDENEKKHRIDLLAFIVESEQMLLKPQADVVAMVEEPKLI